MLKALRNRNTQAEAVVEHAELEIQNCIQMQTTSEDHTKSELNDIHKGLNRQMDEILARQNRGRTRQRSKNLKRF